MTAFLIILVLCIVFGIMSYADKQTAKVKDIESNTGSRYIEESEWRIWGERLIKEYKEITGYPLPELKIEPSGSCSIEGAYYNALSSSTNLLFDRKDLPRMEFDHDKFKADGFTQSDIETGRVTIKDLSRYAKNKIDIPTFPFKDKNALEILRERHNLPTDAEFAIKDNWLLGQNTTATTNHYDSLFDIIEQCVYRSVHELGYKYGGYDPIGTELAMIREKKIEEKYPYLTNDPTNKKE